MPQLQVIDNPYQNSMVEAAQGISGLTNAMSEAKKRQRMQLDMINQLPDGMRGKSLEEYAKDSGLYSEPGVIDKIVGYFKSGKGLTSLSAEPTSAIDRVGASLQPTPAAEVRNNNPNVIRQSTVKELAGANSALGGKDYSESDIAETLKRGRNGGIGKLVDIITNDGDGTKYLRSGVGADGNPGMIPSSREEYDSSLAASDKKYNDALSAYDADQAARKNKVAYVKSGKDPDTNPDFTQWATQHGKKMDAANIQNTLAAYALRGSGPAAAKPEIKLSDLAKGASPQIVEDSSMSPPSPVGAQASPEMQMASANGSYSQAAGRSFKGNHSLLNMAGALLPEEIDYLDRATSSWDGNQNGYAKGLALAEGIKDPDKRAAAERYINRKFQMQMGPNDITGVNKDQIQISDRSSSRSSSGGGGEGDGYGEGSGYVVVSSDGQNARPQLHTRISTGDAAFDGVGAIIGLTVSDPKKVRETAQMVMSLAAQAAQKKEAGYHLTDQEANALEIYKRGTSDLGTALSKTLHYEGKNFKRGEISPEKTINIGDSIDRVNSIKGLVKYDGPEVEIGDGSLKITNAGYFKVRRGDYVPESVAQKAKAKAGSKSTVSGLVTQ